MVVSVMRVTKLVAVGLLALSLSGCAAMLMDQSTSRGSTPAPAEKRSADQVSADQLLASAIRARLSKDPATRPLAVNVSVYQGAVTLRGGVKNAQERSTIERVTRSVGGVKSLRNEIQVR